MVFNIDIDADFATTTCDLRQADELMRKLHACMLRLKRHMNTLIPIGRLPGDVLTEIFLRLVETHDLRDAGSLASPDGYYPHQWIYVTHVCHSWRTLALTCGTLWTRIIFSHSDRVGAFLSRSQGCQVSLEPASREPWFTPEPRHFVEMSERLRSVEKLQVHLYFLRTLAFTCPNGLHFPCLTYLHFAGGGGDAYATNPLYQSSMPRLQVLHCTDTVFRIVRSSIRSTVTTLCVTRGECVSLAEWLDFLSETPQLRKLCIEDAIADAEPPNKLYPSHRRIKLSNLRYLKLSESGWAHSIPHAFLLSRLDLPEETRILWSSTNHQQFWLTECTRLISTIDSAYPTAARTRFCHTQLTVDWAYGDRFAGLLFTAERLSSSGQKETALSILLDIPAGAIEDATTELFARLHALSLPMGIRELTTCSLSDGSRTWLPTMRESKVHEKVAILHVGKDELVHLIPALEESSHDGTTGVLFPELQDIRLVRRHGVEFGTLQGEESVKERLMNVLAKRRARGLGPFSIFLGLKEEQTEEILTSAGQ